MIGQLVIFSTPTQCFDDSTLEEGIPTNVWIEPGNIGILVSEYPAGPSEEYTCCEVLVGDRIVSDVDMSNIEPITLGEINVS